jgi:glycosyltransferase involved in cell wall biosynthesis
MNILYVGPYRQQDGWGRASRDYLKALSLTGYNVAARPIWLSNHVTNTSEQFVNELEAVVFDERPDIIIQNVLPHYGEYQHGMKNILQLYLETSPLIHTNWPAHMQLFDEIWVPTPTEAALVAANRVDVPTKRVPMPFDFSMMDEDIEPYKLPTLDDEDFVFYFIGEYTERKNLAALLVAFHREFHTTENARLVIKTNRGGMSPNELRAAIEENIQALYKTMRIYSRPFGYIPEIVITENLPYKDILALHKRCDCLVMPSRGESTCRPVIEALAMGNQAIVTGSTGMADAARGMAIEVESTLIPASSTLPPVPYLYTANELWEEINILDLQASMRHAYGLRGQASYGPHRDIIKKAVREQYSYEAIAKVIKETL